MLKQRRVLFIGLFAFLLLQCLTKFHSLDELEKGREIFCEILHSVAVWLQMWQGGEFPFSESKIMLFLGEQFECGRKVSGQALGA